MQSSMPLLEVIRSSSSSWLPAVLIRIFRLFPRMRRSSFRIRFIGASMRLEQAVEAAIEYCIRQDILKDFLLKQRAEVVKMSIFEYDEEREMELIRRDEREIGEQIGAEKERKKAEQELKKVKENLDKSQENAVQSMISLCQRLGGTKEQAIEELQGNYGQTEEQAKEKIKTYWKE